MFSGTSQPSIPRVVSPDQVQRVLLVKLSSLGDVVHTLPLVEALRAGLGPHVSLIWAVKSRFVDLLHGNPHVSSVSVLAGSSLNELIRFGKTLRREKPDVALEAQGLLKSGLVTWFAQAPVRIGLDANREGNRLFLTHPVVPATHRAHMVEKLLGFCDAVGVPRLPPQKQTYLIEGERDAAQNLLDETLPAGRSGPVIGCFVGASTPEKTWGQERWVSFCRTAADSGAHVVLLGGAGEADAASAIAQEAGGSVAGNLAGKTPLRVLASLLACCDVVVGGDSGPTHLAVAVGTPVVGLYGVTDPVRTGPDWGPAPAVVLDFAEQDAPPAQRRPRHPAVADALARIPPEAVAEATLRLLHHQQPNDPMTQ